MPCCDLVDTQMTYRRIDTVRELEHSLIGGVSEGVLRIILEPFLCKLLKLHSRCLVAVIDSFLEHYCLSVQFLFDLLLAHTLVGSPSHGLLHVFTVYIIAAAHSDRVVCYWAVTMLPLFLLTMLGLVGAYTLFDAYHKKPEKSSDTELFGT